MSNIHSIITLANTRPSHVPHEENPDAKGSNEEDLDAEGLNEEDLDAEGSDEERPDEERPDEDGSDHDPDDESSGEGEYHAIRDIIQERKYKYLVAWAENPFTGKKDPPAWVLKRHVTANAVRAWEIIKEERLAARRNDPAANSSTSEDRPKTYRYRGAIYEVQGDEPPEWLNGQ